MSWENRASEWKDKNSLQHTGQTAEYMHGWSPGARGGEQNAALSGGDSGLSILVCVAGDTCIAYLAAGVRLEPNNGLRIMMLRCQNFLVGAEEGMKRLWEMLEQIHYGQLAYQAITTFPKGA